MSNAEIPESVNPYQLADKGTLLSGYIANKRLERLSSAVVAIHDGTTASVSFDIDESGRRVIKGQCGASVALQCQRCLESFDVKLSGAFDLALAYNDEMAKALPSYLDGLPISPDQPLHISDLVEEELILSLPMHPVHDEGKCKIKTEFGEPIAPSKKPPNPFDVLKDFK